MPKIQLLNLDKPSVQLLLNSDEEFERHHRVMLGVNWDLVRELGKHTRNALRKNAFDSGWWGYLALDVTTRVVVGSCGFKGAPDARGSVEIVYLTFPDCEGKGYATAMAKGLVDIAFRSHSVRRVVAHTVPEKGASTRVLEKAGFTFVGDALDAEDAPVWRWVLERSNGKGRTETSL